MTQDVPRPHSPKLSKSSMHSVIDLFPKPIVSFWIARDWCSLCWGWGLHFRGVACRFFNLWSCRHLSIMASHGIEWNEVAWYGMATVHNYMYHISTYMHKTYIYIYLLYLDTHINELQNMWLGHARPLDFFLQPRWHMCMSRRQCLEIGDDFVKERGSWVKCGAVSRLFGRRLSNSLSCFFSYFFIEDIFWSVC